MSVPVERARMLLGVWGDRERLVRDLERELAAAEAQRRCRTESGRPCPEEEEAWAQLCDAVSRKIARVVGLCAALTELVESLPPRYRDVLTLRYRKKWEYPRIAMHLYYSEDRIRHLKAEADALVAGRLEM